MVGKISNKRHKLKMSSLFSWSQSEINTYKERKYSIIYELIRLGVDRCIIVSARRQNDIREEIAFTISKDENRWALIDSTFATIKYTESEDYRQCWQPLDLYENCIRLSAYIDQKDEQKCMKALERTIYLIDLMASSRRTYSELSMDENIED